MHAFVYNSLSLSSGKELNQFILTKLIIENSVMLISEPC